MKKTLPYLTYLAILNYRITAEGTLIDINDSFIIQTAKQYGVAPIMFASSITEQGVGDFEVTHTILNNPQIQENLIENIIYVMKQKGYYGLELTFVYIMPEDLPQYTSFIAEAARRLSSEGFPLFTSLLPATLGYQPGTVYNNTYYADIGRAADYVILISYLWSNAAISQVAQTGADFAKEYTEFAVTQIAPEKIFIGLTRMAYDWELPYEEGKTPGRLITSFGAMTLASQLGSAIQFDDPTQTPYFYYTESGIQHFVWFKDAKTVQAIVNLVTEYGLRGVAVWNIMYYYNPTWLVINTQYDIVNLFDNTLS